MSRYTGEAFARAVRIGADAVATAKPWKWGVVGLGAGAFIAWWFCRPETRS